MHQHSRATQLITLLTTLPVIAYAVFASASLIEPIRYTDTAVFFHCGRSEGLYDLLICGRPITAALMYRAFVNDPNAIVLFHTILALASWIFAAASISMLAKHLVIRIVAFNAVLATYVYFGIHTFNSALMADSLGASLTVALIGSAALYIRTGRCLWLLAVVFLLWANVRDTNAWTAFAIAGMCAVIAMIYRQSRQRYAAVAMVAALSAVPFFAIEAATVSESLGHQRWVFPFFNNMGQRILTNPEATQFFANRGMPVSEALLSRAGTWASSDNGHFYVATELEAFRAWTREHGKATYVRYLLSTPFARLAEAIEHANAMFFVSFTSLKEFSAFDNRIVIKVISLALLIPLLALLVGQSRDISVFGLSMALPALAHAFVVYHGDPMEITRHAVAASVQLSLSLTVTLIAVAECAAAALAELPKKPRQPKSISSRTTPIRR